MHGTKVFVRDKEKFEIWKFELERESSAGINGNVQGTEKIVRDREKFVIEGVRDRESPLYSYDEILRNYLFSKVH